MDGAFFGGVFSFLFLPQRPSLQHWKQHIDLKSIINPAPTVYPALIVQIVSVSLVHMENFQGSTVDLVWDYSRSARGPCSY